MPHPQRPTVVHLLGSRQAGGAETFFVRLMTALHKPAYAAELHTIPVVRRGSWVARELTARGIPHHTLPLWGGWDVFSKMMFQRVCKQVGADAVLAWMNRAAAMLRPAHAVPWVQLARIGGYYKLSNYTGKTTGLVVNTHDLARYATAGGWAPGSVQYLPNFIPAPAAGFQAHRGPMRTRLELPEQAQVGLLAGRLHPNKGVDVALHALAQLPPHFYLLLVGAGPEEANLRALAEKIHVAGRVRWAGWQSDLAPYAAAADVWLVPSRLEPLGNVVLDAWAHTLPVVAAKAAGPLELIEPGQTGLLTELNDAPGLASAWQTVAGDARLAAQMGSAGHATYQKNFAEEVVVRQFIAYFKQQLNEHTPA